MKVSITDFPDLQEGCRQIISGAAQSTQFHQVAQRNTEIMADKNDEEPEFETNTEVYNNMTAEEQADGSVVTKTSDGQSVFICSPDGTIAVTDEQADNLIKQGIEDLKKTVSNDPLEKVAATESQVEDVSAIFNGGIIPQINSDGTTNTNVYGYSQDDLMKEMEKQNRSLKQKIEEMKAERVRKKEEDAKAQAAWEKRYKTYYTSSSLSLENLNMNYEHQQKEAVWDEEYKSRMTESPFDNYELLKNYITRDVIQNFGGSNRIQSFFVDDGFIIINGVKYTPMINRAKIDWSLLPADLKRFLEQGAIGYAFNFSRLEKMRNITRLGFTDLAFVRDYVAPDLGLQGRIGVSSFERICPNLVELWLGNDYINYAEPDKEKLTQMKYEAKQTMQRERRKFNLLNGYHLNVCGGTQRVQDFAFESVSNYARNRGEKGFLRYACGTVARAGFAGVAGIANFGTHLIKGIFGALKEGMTPVNPDEINLN